MHKILVVGLGFAGATCARLLADAGYVVHAIDRRPHIGGNAYDCHDEAGLLIHPYGPHIFHTNSKRVLEYLSRFTEWRFYEHRVKSVVGERLFDFPINRKTICEVFGRDLTPEEAKSFLEKQCVKIDPVRTSEDLVLSSVGPILCDQFFRGYTLKQWGRGLEKLKAGVAARIPVRFDDDDRYFSDTYQLMPAQGYSALFTSMLDHPNITIELGADYEPPAPSAAGGLMHTVYTGPIDAYFAYSLGHLPYRSLRFEHYHIADTDLVQKAAVYNFPNSEDYTRITEFKQITGQKIGGSSLVKEYPTDEGDPYYPIPSDESEAVFQQYKSLADQETSVTFVGRLAQYRYYNMDQVVAAAMHAADEICGKIRS